MLKYIDNMDTELGDTREVIGVVYPQRLEPIIYKSFAFEPIGVVVEDHEEEETK